MHKAGRYTSALLLVLVGAFVIVDKASGSHFTPMLVEWWPLLFISLGIEYILFNMKYGGSDRQLRLDVTGIIFAVIISAVVIVSTQTVDIFKKFDGFHNIGDVISSFGEGRKFEKGTTSIAMASSVENVKVINRNGTVDVKSGNVDKLQVELTVYVNLKDEKEANRIADESKLEYRTSGNALEIAAVSEEYSSSFLDRSYPRMDLVITMPAQQKVNLDIRTMNGKIIAAQLPIKQRVAAETSNGEIQIAELEGELNFKTTNGAVTSDHTSGPMSLKTSNGKITVTEHRGDAQLESTNGDIKVQHVSGNTDAHTSNGSIKIDGKLMKLKAVTSNGSVEAASETVGGDWDVRTTHGKIELRLPSQGDYRVDGEGQEGSIKSSLPLNIAGASVKGTVGNGKYTVKLKTSDSISIQPSN